MGILARLRRSVPRARQRRAGKGGTGAASRKMNGINVRLESLTYRGGYQAKWANALFASAMRWTFSRFV